MFLEDYPNIIITLLFNSFSMRVFTSCCSVTASKLKREKENENPHQTKHIRNKRKFIAEK